MNVLNSPVAKVYADRAPQLAPALWIGDCFENGTGTKQGWTQDKLSSFLGFLDTQRIQRIGVWCMTNESDPIGFPCPVDSCPWMLDELRKWKKRPAAPLVSTRSSLRFGLRSFPNNLRDDLADRSTTS